jgi:hypothetical protein
MPPTLTYYFPVTRRTRTMAVQFLLFLMTILLISIFWELSKINSLFKKTLSTLSKASERPTVDVRGAADDNVTAKAMD